MKSIKKIVQLYIKQNRYMRSKTTYKKNRLLNYYIEPFFSDKPEKITDTSFFIPKPIEFTQMSNYNYRVAQIKQICKHYKLKTTGTKSELFTQSYNYLRMSYHITNVQKIFRGHIMRKCMSYQGPGLKERNRCVNETDFYTMQNLHEIPVEQFFSFTDSDNFIYGFDIISIYTLLNTRIKKPKKHENPYNRNEFPKFVKQRLANYLMLSSCLQIKVNTKDEDDDNIIAPEKQVDFSALELFQYIDNLGNYSQAQWFTSLSKVQLVMYVRELYDIWSYRANLSEEVKRNICPPSGDPFRGSNLISLNTRPLIETQQAVLHIMSKFVKSSHTTDNQSLGAFYVLSALTLVNSAAAEALPWLFQSVSHIN
tara:strand:+ start:1013 stop:2113 length:1101 start_codon:yes stop_codon:yes gene_type:complete